MGAKVSRYLWCERWWIRQTTVSSRAQDSPTPPRARDDVKGWSPGRDRPCKGVCGCCVCGPKLRQPHGPPVYASLPGCTPPGGRTRPPTQQARGTRGARLPVEIFYSVLPASPLVSLRDRWCGVALVGEVVGGHCADRRMAWLGRLAPVMGVLLQKALAYVFRRPSRKGGGLRQWGKSWHRDNLGEGPVLARP